MRFHHPNNTNYTNALKQGFEMENIAFIKEATCLDIVV